MLENRSFGSLKRTERKGFLLGLKLSDNFGKSWWRI